MNALLHDDDLPMLNTLSIWNCASGSAHFHPAWGGIMKSIIRLFRHHSFRYHSVDDRYGSIQQYGHC
jgi:hypothetical protein